MSSDQRNLILAVALSVGILLAFDWLFLQPQQEAQRQAQLEQQQASEQPAPADEIDAPSRPQPGVTGGAAPEQRSRAEALNDSPRINIETPRLHGSLKARGGRIDDLTLADYYQTTKRESEVELLSPAGAPKPYYAEFGWVPAPNSQVALPGSDTLWDVSGDTLSPGQPVTKRWSNDQGLTFERTVAVDENYMFTVTERVTNESGEPVQLYPYALVSRHGEPETLGFFIMHEGPIGVLNETLYEHGYGELADDGRKVYDARGGWLGITDKYWLVSVIPPQNEQVQARFLHTPATAGKRQRYQTDYLGSLRQIAPGETAEVTHRLFAGAKEVDLLDGYSEELGLYNFNRAVDFGMFWFMTIPFFHALDFFGNLTGNFGVAIILFTVILRLVMFPLANKSFKELGRMKELQPQMKALQERHADDRERLQKELMELYKREKVNPVSGCLPILLQIPIFFALYKVLFVTIEMRHAPFFGWIEDLSARDPTSLFNLFGLLPYGVPDFLQIGIWPLIMGLTMWAQQKLNPAPTDPMQARVMMLLPPVFTVLLASFPAGLVIYWATSNALSIAQQWVIMRTTSKKKEAKAAS